MNLRDHGYGDSPKTQGTPRVLGDGPAPCPNCGCATYMIEVPVTAPRMLRVPDGSRAVGVYTGCPACPWASPMITTARPQPPGVSTD